MAPSNQLGKRVKLTQVRRPFIVGSTALPFSDTNPKPAGVPDGHTHSWEVFVKGIEDTDITYWVRRVQFKLHESIPHHVRSTSSLPLPLPQPRMAEHPQLTGGRNSGRSRTGKALRR